MCVFYIQSITNRSFSPLECTKTNNGSIYCWLHSFFFNSSMSHTRKNVLLCIFTQQRITSLSVYSSELTLVCIYRCLSKKHALSKIPHGHNHFSISIPDQYNHPLILTGPSAHLFSHRLIFAGALWPLLTPIWAVNIHDQIPIRCSNGFSFTTRSFSTSSWFQLSWDWLCFPFSRVWRIVYEVISSQIQIWIRVNELSHK